MCFVKTHRCYQLLTDPLLVINFGSAQISVGIERTGISPRICVHSERAIAGSEDASEWFIGIIQARLIVPFLTTTSNMSINQGAVSDAFPEQTY